MEQSNQNGKVTQNVTLDLRPVLLLHVVCQDWLGIFVPQLPPAQLMGSCILGDGRILLGGPILRIYINGWDKKWELLRLLPAIPFCSAHPHQVKWRAGCQSWSLMSSDVDISRLPSSKCVTCRSTFDSWRDQVRWFVDQVAARCIQLLDFNTSSA